MEAIEACRMLQPKDRYWLGRWCGLISAPVFDNDFHSKDFSKGYKQGQMLKERIDTGYYGKQYNEFIGKPLDHYPPTWAKKQKQEEERKLEEYLLEVEEQQQLRRGRNQP